MKQQLATIMVFGLLFIGCTGEIGGLAELSSDVSDVSRSDSGSSGEASVSTVQSRSSSEMGQSDDTTLSSSSGAERVYSVAGRCNEIGTRPGNKCVDERGGQEEPKQEESDSPYYVGYKHELEDSYCGEFLATATTQGVPIADFLVGSSFQPLDETAEAYAAIESNTIPLGENLIPSFLPIKRWVWWNPHGKWIEQSEWQEVQVSKNCVAGNVECEVAYSYPSCDLIWTWGKQGLARVDSLGFPLIDSDGNPIDGPYEFDEIPTKVEIVAKGAGFLTIRAFPFLGPDEYDNRQAGYKDFPTGTMEDIVLHDDGDEVVTEWAIVDVIEEGLTSDYQTFTVPINSVDVPKEINRLLEMNVQTRYRERITPTDSLWTLEDPFAYEGHWLMIKSIKFL